MEKKVYFKNTNKTNLCGIISNPSENIENLMVIFVHGFNSSKDTKKNYSTIGLLGTSFGGCVALSVAAKRKDLIFLILNSPVIDYGERAQESLSKDQINNWKIKGIV